MFRIVSGLLMYLVFSAAGFSQDLNNVQAAGVWYQIHQTPAAQNTWLVDLHGGGDFTDIQSAINASAPGDVILVLPSATGGIYSAFTMDSKGVTIKAIYNGSSKTFNLSYGPIIISNIPADQKAALSGFTGTPDNIQVNNCNGQVMLENISIDYSQLTISSSRNVLGSTINITNFGYDGLDGMTIKSNSTVYLDGIEVTPNSYGNFDGGKGAKAINVSGSFVIIANPKKIIGCKGTDGILDFYCYQIASPKAGGSALYALTSTVAVIGDSSQSLIEGGQGGGWLIGGIACGSPDGLPQALAVENNRSAVTISNTTVSGGGSYITDNSLPSSFASSDFRLGIQASQWVNNWNQGFVFYIYSDVSGSLKLNNWFGSPLVAITGGNLFGIIGGGRGSAFIKWTVQNDPVWLGYSLIMQAAIFEDSGRTVLTNPVVRVIGQ